MITAGWSEPVEGSLLAFARTGRVGREIGAHAELLAALGPRSAINGFLEARRHGRAAVAVDRAFYRALWLASARQLGASVADESDGALRIQLNGRMTRTCRQWTTLDDALTIRASLDKTIVNARLEELGVPMPDSVECRLTDLSRAEELLLRTGTVVVKPARGTGGGMGATSGVKTVPMLRRAALIASRRSDTVLVERHVAGPVYRLLFLDGELLEVVRKDPPTVTGDGSSTVRQLIAGENQRRWAARGELGLQLVSLTLDTVIALSAQGLDLGRVPAPARAVLVRGVTNQSGPGDSRIVLEALGEGLVSEARRSVEAVGLRLAGVDVITADLGSSLADSGGALLEVNGGPGLHHHYLVSNRDAARDVCTPILRRALGAD
jgi:cyanophycin synthetase